MRRPLYHLPDEHTPLRGPQGHAGLWFDKFCDEWCGSPSWNIGQNKLRWINKLTDEKVGGDHVGESACRLMALARATGGHSHIFITESRFVTGLGRSHPVENGFAWHPTLGTPFLPGSSIKGMVRAWAKAEGVPQPGYEGLLGSPGEVGRVVLLDAVPTEPVLLEADVMTPHFGGWSPDDPPGDWRSPRPIPFLVTATGTPFLFCLVPTSTTKSDDLAVAFKWLCGSLAWAGAGAKTAVGYGRMRRDESRERGLQNECDQQKEAARRRREDERRRAALSPIEQEIERILADRKHDGVPRTTAIFQEIVRGRWKSDDKKAAARWLETAMRAEKRWKVTSQKKRPEKDKDYQRTRRIQVWLDE